MTQVNVKEAVLTKQQQHVKQLNEIVKTNFETLIIGARRLGVTEEDDGFAPERINSQSDGIRLHPNRDIKEVNGVKTVDGNERIDESDILKDEDIKVLVNLLNQLFEEAADEKSTSISIEVHEK